ncbi:MAG TPA: homoserine kinase [Nitrospinae bacterium]|nr:homoserine kinase [Nitrospinota bacterium]
MPLVRVQVPSSTTNLGPGFDALGVALNLYNRVELDELPWGLSVHVEGEGMDVIPRDETNISVEAVKRVYQKAGRTLPGLWMKQRNHIPLARGLGSSSAALVGGLVGGNLMLGSPLSMDDLVQLAVEMEGHPDNVVPALVGGFCISAIGEDGRTLYTRAPVVDRYRWVIVVPSFEVSTKEARLRLPGEISLSDATFNVQRVGMLMAAFAYGQNELFREAMDDKLHQPYRKELMGPLDEIFAAAYEAGALGVCISGAGPCVLALCDPSAGKVGLAMRDVYRSHGIGTQMHVLRIAAHGAHAVDTSGQDIFAAAAS